MMSGAFELGKLKLRMTCGTVSVCIQSPATQNPEPSKALREQPAHSRRSHLLADDQIEEIVGADCIAEQATLRIVTAMFTEEHKLLLGFHAFGDDFHFH